MIIRVALLLSLCALLTGCPDKGDVSRSLNAQATSAPERGPVMLAAYQPWFGRPGHIDVGYSSQDRVVLQKQIMQAKALSIAAFVVNWYGPAKDFEDRSYATLQNVAAANDFKVAIMYDEHSDDPDRATDQAINDLKYAYDRYIGPQASLPRQAYLTYQDHPVIFIFPKDAKTDWKRVRETVSSWQSFPLLIYKGNKTRFPDAFDGFYAWPEPGDKGWTPDGSNWGEGYLESFYKDMTNKFPGKLAVGAAWPGFDDSRASWSRNRKMNGRCGKTFDESLKMFRRYYTDSNPLPFLMIATWNDYEEGTAIEKGLDRCHGGNLQSPMAAAR
jgi:hypothetical protein